MTAIAAFVEYEDRTGPRAQTVLRMLEAMRGRGAGPAAVRAYRWAALGDRPVRTGPPAPATPACAEGGRDVHAVHDGEILTLASLRATLAGHGDVVPDAGTATVLAAGYRRWGTGLAERLDGQYAVAIWDPAAAEGLLIRDRLGARPLYYSPLSGGVLVASTPEGILASGLVEPAVDLAGLRELLAFVRNPGRTAYRGIHEVPPGHVVRLTRDGCRLARYWDPPAGVHPADLAAATTGVRERLEAAVARCVDAGEPVTALLSGEDSAAVTALAAPLARARTGAALPSLSVRFELTLPGVPRQPSPLRPLAAHLGTEHRDATVNVLRLTLPATRAAAARARGGPSLGEFDTAVYLLFQEVGRRADLVLSGDGADELFGGYYWLHDPDATAGGFPWRDLIAGHDRFAALLAPDLRAALDLAAYRADSYADALARVPVNPADSPADRRMRQVEHLHLTRFLPIVLERTDRMAAAAGVRVRAPFLDRELVEYAAGVPWSQKVAGGAKSLLRAATRDLFPPPVAAAPDDHREAPSASNLAYHRSLCGEVGDLLADAAAPVRPLLDVDAVKRALAAEPAATTLNRMETDLELVLGVNDWLAGTRIRLAW